MANLPQQPLSIKIRLTRRHQQLPTRCTDVPDTNFLNTDNQAWYYTKPSLPSHPPPY
jgi:hypothetical protein